MHIIQPLAVLLSYATVFIVSLIARLDYGKTKWVNGYGSR